LPGRLLGEVPASVEVEDAPDEPRILGVEHFGELLVRPDIELPLAALAVRVLGRVERTSGVSEIPADVLDHLLRHLGVAALPGGEEGFDVRHHE
jgi:hypothetical protein